MSHRIPFNHITPARASVGARSWRLVLTSLLFGVIGAANPAWARTAQWNASFPGLVNPVLALTVWDPDGVGPLAPVLIASGGAHIVGTDPYHNIAYWDTSTSTWQPLGSGMQGPGPSVGTVRSLIVYNGDLIAAGNFSTAGGVAANSIARWSGTLAGGSWQPLGSGISQVGAGVISMAVYGTSLMVGGNFGGAGGLTQAGGVALWNGAAWSKMNDGFNQSPSAVCVYAGRAYASGSFSAAVNGAFLNGIGSWASPGPWQSPGNGLTFVGLAMSVYNNELVVAGVSGPSAIMRWNGSTWANLGAGVPGYVNALNVFDDGSGPDLIAAGSFTTAGGAPANRIARWDGSTWKPLGSGLPSDVNALTVYNGQLVAGGNFSTSNGTPANFIAAFDSKCSGDLNGDNLVDDSDFVIFASAYNILDCADPAMPADCPADLNGDGVVDDSDFVSFVAAYNALICP